MNQSKISPEIECTRYCNSRQHGSLLTSAITKRAVSDAALASFCRYTCCNFLNILDIEGRSLLHMVASRGRRALLEWMIRYYSQNSPNSSNIIDYKDPESGYTAFHRSVFYGQVQTAVSLMKSGVNISIMDNEDMTAIDLALIDRHPRFDLSKDMPCEVYTWGANSNYTLGTSSQHHRNFPEPLSIFTKQGIHIKQVCLSKFHSVFVSSTGSVWTCGHGEGGRLGIAASESRVLPSNISLSESCTQAAVGRDHTLFLLHSGTILSCGLNDHHQLGQVPPPKLSLSPHPVKVRLALVKGICAARYHSVAYNENVVYTWGLNGGQLGHPKEQTKTVLVPRKVLGVGNPQANCKIADVAVSDGATVVLTNKDDIFLLSQYQTKRIGFSHRLFNIKTIKVIGGEVVGGDHLTEQQKQIMVLILISHGVLYIWQESTNHFTRCIFNLNRELFIKEVALTRETVMLITKHGEAFQGNIIPKKITFNKSKNPNEDMISPKEKNRHDFHQFINKDECILIKVKRLPNIHRAVDICCDSKGNNFAVLQVVPNSSLLDLPQVTSSQMKEDMMTLLDETTEDDLLHDVIFKVQNNSFPAHRYIVSHASEYLESLCSDNKNIDEVLPVKIDIENIHPLIFKQILLYMYTGTCDLMTLGPCNIKIEIKEDDINKMDIYEEDLELMSNVSAYEVYNKKEKHTKKNKDKSNKNKEKNQINDPVRLLQSAAKKLQINSLYKILGKYGWYNGNIVLRDEDCKLNNPKHQFDRNKMLHMLDANIKCSDGDLIKVHKCVLAARLDYFGGMFAHSWAESSRISTISLPINHKMLTPIINFLYTDECPELRKCEDFEFIGNMLVICDQFFIVRMREMCEVALSSLLTLKNVTDILQVADTYNCPQLKRCCMEYISLNLSNLLETKSLEALTPNLLDQLSEYYISFNPIMSTRIITPYSDCASDEVVMSIADNFPINITDNRDDDELMEEIKKSLNISGSDKKKKTRVKKISISENEKTRKRNESLSSINSFDMSNEKNEDVELCLSEISNIGEDPNENGWTKVLNTQLQKQQKIVQARLKTVIAVKDNSKLLETQPENYTKLVKTDIRNVNNDASYSPVQSPTQRPVFGSPYKNTPIIIPNEKPVEDINDSPQITLNVSVVNTKLSQKQRKKLALESKNNSLLAEQLNKLNKKQENTISSTESHDVQPQKNPWQKIEMPIVSTPTNSKVNFNEILEDQRKQKENLSKMLTKSLALTQLEDKAIEELTRYYNSLYGEEERILVKRVPCDQIAAPQWIHKSFKNSPTRI